MTTATRQIFEPAESGGRAIPYVLDGEGPTVVLLPAAGLDIVTLGTLASILVEEDFRVLRVGSRRPAAGVTPTLHDLAQDVVDVMDHVGVTDAWIGGHALGGTLARIISVDHTDRGPPPSFGPVAVRVVGFQLMGALPSVVDRCEVSER